ncbi:MAG: hypothetical protein EB048_09855, partial [Gammaproteobacteria bacterium]|nr:hypothetical protein [Gammaproteobacteria bacterium]
MATHHRHDSSPRAVSRREWLAGLGLLALAPGATLARSTASAPSQPAQPSQHSLPSRLDETTFDEYLRMRTASDGS